eukprot:gene13838-16316_t
MECVSSSTPLSIATTISKSLAKRVIVALFNGELVSLSTKLSANGSLALLDFEQEGARRVFWWNASLIAARAVQIHFGDSCTITATNAIHNSNALLDGFNVDFHLTNRRNPKPEDIAAIHTIIERLIKSNHPFKLDHPTIDQARKEFKDNAYMMKQLEEVEEKGGKWGVVRFDGLATVAKGDIPVMETSGQIKFIEIIRNSSVVGSIPEIPSLQRIGGVAFFEKAQLAHWHNLHAEAAALDHRNIGRDQALFFFHPYSPGSCFFLPHGARIYNALQTFLRAEYRKRGFEEVITPNIYERALWETSGHWDNYKDNMYSFKADHTTFSLKPMNCPGHCIIYASSARSYRELPMRLADFGVLHRDETHGSLSGLTRVRRFQQDDAHIFCTANQIREEIAGCLSFLRYVYDVFGFSFDLELSTRPTPHLGELELWEVAEKSLADVLNDFGQPWRLNPGDGAFYGPKIDVHIKDANGRSHQCATIQLDFQLPIRFGLEYATGEGGVMERPVMIHRAIFGSIERMMAILIEHTKGKWPFWLSPRQCLVTTVSTGVFDEHAQKVKKQLFDAGYHVDVDISDKTLQKKLREAIALRYNYMVVIGNEEVANNTVTIRRRDSTEQQTMSIDQLLAEFKDNITNFK